VTTLTITTEYAVYETYTDGTRATPVLDRESAIRLAESARAHLDTPGPHRLCKVETVSREVVDGTAGAWLPIEEES